MEHITFDNKQTILDHTNTKSTFYILSKGIWRAYQVVDGDENTLWFKRYSDVIYIEIAPNYSLESLGESEAYPMDKKDLDELYLTSHAISNLICRSLSFRDKLLFLQKKVLP